MFEWVSSYKALKLFQTMRYLFRCHTEYISKSSFKRVKILVIREFSLY